MRYLVAVSIGPVQEFIAAARKTRDLWFGSALLSAIAAAAASALQASGATLIFPHPEALEPGSSSTSPVPRGGEAAADDRSGLGRTLGIANKILAEVETDDPRRLVAAVRKAARVPLEEAAGNLVAHLGGRQGRIDWDLLQRQVDDFLEFFSAWTPLDPSDYRSSRARVERLLAGRKALRDFRPAEGRDGVPKSSLDPSRESVLHSNSVEDRRSLGLRRGEELDGISLIKRLRSTRRFVSVTRVAIDPLIRRIEGRDELRRLNEIANELDRRNAEVEGFAAGPESGLHQYAAFPFDTQLFYQDGAGDERILKDLEPKAREFNQIVRTLCHELEIGDPPAYLAVLQADGDRMGKAIAALESVERHRAFSRALSVFAREAEGIVARHQGALVYSGGDDVLAFLPLDTVLDCADVLRQLFADAVGLAAPDGRASLSVGVAIGHFLQPLDDLRTWARAAEQAAKRERKVSRGGQVVKERGNALAVALYTRSSGAEGITAVLGWGENPVKERWQRWIDWYAMGAIPDGAAYELRALRRELGGLGEATGAGDLLDRELRRILSRKRQESGERLTKEVVEAVSGWVGGDPRALAEVVTEMIIARRLQGAAEVARGPRQPARSR